MRINVRRALVTCALAIACATPAYAQQQSVSINLGWFSVRGEDARVADDVLFENLDFLAFRISDFNHATISGEWLIGLGDYVEAGVGAGYYRRTVPTVYFDYVERNGTEIEQNLRLRIVPLTLTARVLPLGRRAKVEPYIGGGIAFYRWRYSETGEFLDFSDFTTFNARYVAEDTDMGPVFLAGVRVPASRNFAIGGEFRYQGGKGTLGIENGFLGDKIDLGGYHALVTLQFKF